MKKYQKLALIEVLGTASDGDYLVQNEGNATDQWIIPKETFEATYMESKQDFGWAVHQLKEGKKVAREGWNGKGMFIYLVKGTTILDSQLRNEAKTALCHLTSNGTKVINSHIDMKAADGSIVVGWLASQTDMLAEDWEVVE